MLHLGDITKINGHHVPIVDCVIGGSPCQGLSVAGLGKGLDDERSGLFTEQIRITKEMREADVRNGRSGHDIRPRYMVWENVPGAFSSNGGEDFRVVLEELARVVEEGVTIPRPEKGKWATTGVIIGDNWSLAWRVFDAQYWGVPQRRRRICIVVDFNGHTAPQIVFSEGEHHGSTERGDCKPSLGYLGAKPRSEVQSISEGLSGHLESSQPQREEAASDASRGIGADDSERSIAYTMKIRGGCEGGGKGALIQTEKSATPSTLQDQTLFQPCFMVMQCYSKSKRAQSKDDNETWVESDKTNTLNAFDVGDVRTTECVVALDGASFNQGKNAKFDFEVSDSGINSPIVAKGPSAVCYAVDQGGGKSACNITEEQAPTLTCTHGGEPAVCYGINGDKAGTLDSSYYKGCGMRSGVERDIVAVPQKTRYIVRRLTPLECERLQGFPDGWTDIGEFTDTKGKKGKTSDAARYKPLGHSIALPSW